MELSSFMSIDVKFVKVTVQDTWSKDNNTVNIIKKSKWYRAGEGVKKIRFSQLMSRVGGTVKDRD